MRVRTIAILLAVCLLASSAPAAVPLADKLPKGTLFYFGWVGRSLTGDGSMFGQLLNHPAVDDILAALKDAARKDMRDKRQGELFDRGWAMGRIGWRHPVAMALIDLRRGEGGEPVPMAAILIDLGKEREAFARHLDQVVDALKKDFPFVQGTSGAVTYRIHKVPGEPEIVYWYSGNLFFATLGEQTARDLIALTKADSLQEDKTFKQCMAAVGGENLQLAYYANVSQLNKRIESLVAPPGEAAGAGPMAAEVRRIAEALGVDKVTAAAGAMCVEERGMATKARIFTPAPHRGLLLPLAGGALAEADLAGAPADADVVAAIKLPPEAAYAQLRQILNAVQPEADDELVGALAALEKRRGVSLTKDVLPSLGDTWVLTSAPSLGGFLTGTLLTVQVKDAKRLSAALKKLASPPRKPATTKPAAPAEKEEPAVTIEVLRSGRTEIHYLAAGRAGEIVPVAPAWAVHKDKLYLAAYPQVIQAAIANEGAKPITQDAAFRKARLKIAGKPSALVYVNTPKIARQVYHAVLVGWTLAANALPRETGITAKPDWLPPLSSVEKFLWPQIAAVSADPQGITFQGYGSLPSPSVCAGLVLNRVPLWLLVQQATRARETVEMARLRELSMALSMYQADHDGKMPASLKAPKLAEYSSRPIDTTKYVYLPPRGNKKPAAARQAIVLYVAPTEGQPTVIVAFRDGSVRRLPRARFEQMLKAQRAAPKKR